MIHKPNRTLLQLTAMSLMLIDHIGAIYFPDVIIFRVMGRLCFPLYAYLTAIGFYQTRSVFIYAVRLLLLAGLSQWAYWGLLGYRLNVIFLLFLSVLFLRYLQKRRFTLAIFIALVVWVLPIEYGLYGLLLVVIFAYTRNTFWLVGLTFIVCAFSTTFYGPLQFVAFFAVFLILYLPEVRLTINRTLWRLFYPAHLYLLKGMTCLSIL